MITVTILKPGDLLVLNFGDRLVPKSTKEKIESLFTEAGITNKIIYLDGGTTVSVLSKEETFEYS